MPIHTSRSKTAHAAYLPLLAFACCAWLQASAVELGDIRIHSERGRPLRASIALLGDDGVTSEARCFAGVLLDGDQRIAELKAVLQQSARGPTLLLAGGAGTRPAYRLLIENRCETGPNREYALPFLPSLDSGQAEGLRKAEAEEALLSRKLRALESKMARVFSSAEVEGVLRAAAAAGQAQQDDQALALKLERSLASPSGEPRPAAHLFAVLLAAVAAGAAGWLVLRLRAMNAAPKPLVDEKTGN